MSFFLNCYHCVLVLRAHLSESLICSWIKQNCYLFFLVQVRQNETYKVNLLKTCRENRYKVYESRFSKYRFLILWLLKVLLNRYTRISLGLPRWLSGKESACQCRIYRRHCFDPWLGKISWRRKWQPTPVFLPEKSPRQWSLVGHGVAIVQHDLTTEPAPMRHVCKYFSHPDQDAVSYKAFLSDLNYCLPYLLP